jgi:hypothetical protein
MPYHGGLKYLNMERLIEMFINTKIRIYPLEESLMCYILKEHSFQVVTEMIIKNKKNQEIKIICTEKYLAKVRRHIQFVTKQTIPKRRRTSSKENTKRGMQSIVFLIGFI